MNLLNKMRWDYLSYGIVFFVWVLVVIIWPPYVFHIGGTDAGNYMNAAAHYAYSYETSENFYPSLIEKEDKLLLNNSLTD